MKRLLPVLLLAACGAESDDGDGPTAIELDRTCVEGLSVCEGRSYRACQGGAYVTVDECGAGETCTPGVGCGGCAPGVDLCVGDVLHACTAEGAIGDPVERCADGCEDGRCVDDCAEGADLVYVVDSDYALLSFDPRTEAFRRVGSLRCPAARSWPEWPSAAATPFSMSVDRGGRAWVLFTSGEVFFVDTRDASCAASGFERGQAGFELFGMGFVSDAPGSRAETLYVAGGRVGQLGAGQLGAIDPGTLALTPIGSLPRGDVGPELTGNANAELFGYFPGDPTRVARLDKASAREADAWSLPALSGQPRAWAFAHWGGRYYIYVSTQRGGSERSQVLRLDPSDGSTETVIDESPYRVVGAGVSTCAPTVSNF